MLKLGILSDTHDRLKMIDRAIDLFNQEKVGVVIHAGDFISPFSADRFRALDCPLIGVFGNNDGDHEALRVTFDSFGAQVTELFAQLDMNSKRIAVLHGDRPNLLKTVIDSELFHLVIVGHTHAFKVEKKRGSIIINPGECCGYLSGKSTVAIFDMSSSETRRIDL